MRSGCILVILASVLAGTGHVTAQAPVAVTVTDADQAFTELQRDFGVLYRSLQNMTGLEERDRDLVKQFRLRVVEFSEQWPDHAGGVAMNLVLARWLGDKTTVAALYERLAELRPDDATLALSSLTYREERDTLDPEEMISAYRQLSARFPDVVAIRVALGERLRDEMAYDEAIDVLASTPLEPAEEPVAVLTLAQCLFAENRYDEALAKLESIPVQDGTVVQALGSNRSLIDQMSTWCRDYVGLWIAEQELRASEAEADDLPRVAITTPRGRIVIELFENEAPNTVANFISLSESGFYAETKFHRLERDFMIQGGDPNTKPDGTGTPGVGNPGYFIPDEHGKPGDRRHFGDSVAMANSGRPNSGACQFYLNHRATPWLNGKHTVFGRVVEGPDIARALRVDDEITSIEVLRKRDHVYEPETLPLATVLPKKTIELGNESE